MRMRTLLLGLTLVGAAFTLAACGGQPGPAGPAGPVGPAGPAGPAGEVAVADLTCTECHNDTTVILSKDAQFSEGSLHGTGESYVRGEEAACAGCHGTEGVTARIEAGLPPHDAAVVGVVNPSPFACRTCHEIHTSYTAADWALIGGSAPVVLEITGGTFDGGAGNLCANCHQVRSAPATAEAGNVKITTQRYGPHYGVEAQMLLGEGGLGVTGTPSIHYAGVDGTCVNCHMGDEVNHTFLPDAARCQACHAEAEDFDVNGVQTEIAAMLEELHTIFVDEKMLNPETDLWGIYDSAAGKFINPSADAPLVVPEAVAQAMWNYKLVTYDGSMGVHNSAYAKAMLEAALETMK